MKVDEKAAVDVFALEGVAAELSMTPKAQSNLADQIGLRVVLAGNEISQQVNCRNHNQV